MDLQKNSPRRDHGKERMFDTICTLPLKSDLFAQALHPSQSVISVGLASGHVQCYRIPDAASSAEASPEPKYEKPNGGLLRRRTSIASESGLGAIETIWSTRRHKGSCRALAYSHDGEILFSAGTDGLLKAAKSGTGKVTSKVAIPSADGSE